MFKSVDALPDADVRREQIDEARRLASGEGTVSRKTLHVAKAESPMHQRRVTKWTPPPGLLKGHEAFLKALETSGAEIEIEKCDGSKVRGFVKHSDKYTISLRTKVCESTFRDRVIFKHDISEFSAITPRFAMAETETGEGQTV